MSMHRGAEILGSIAGAGFGGSTPAAISNPNVAAPGGTPLQKVQAAAAGDPISTAYSLTVTASNGTVDTFTTAQTSGGRWIVADSAGNIISLELIERSIAEAAHVPGALLASGAGTDHLADGQAHTLEDVIAAYEMQCEAIERRGGRIILMASRALAAVARGPDDYQRVYGRVLSQLQDRAILHWLGEMFDPALPNYWGASSYPEAMEVCVGVIERNRDHVDGIKISLLDKDKEILMRRRLPPGCRMYTGDDFNYPELIEGDSEGHSDALLGIFDAIAPAAASALASLAAGDLAAYHATLAPTLPLSRHMFAAPTRFYKTGVVFMAYLNGYQSHFTLVGGQQSARSLLHLAELFRLADQAGLLREPEQACAQMGAVLAVHGIG